MSARLSVTRPVPEHGIPVKVAGNLGVAGGLMAAVSDCVQALRAARTGLLAGGVGCLGG